ncbi:hypothetical protein GOV12_06485 [Candidatus Pacearchaeota archaeon]|nr:hypothetical protein [Candidatus Pacearchaeota archaeon]
MAKKDYLTRQEKKIEAARQFFIPRIARKLEVMAGYTVLASWIATPLLLVGYGLYQGASAGISYFNDNYNQAAPAIEDMAQDIGDMFDDLIS